MIKVYLEKIDQKRKSLKISRAKLAKSVNYAPDTLFYFLKRGKQLKSDLQLIDDLCRELNLNWRDIIK